VKNCPVYSRQELSGLDPISLGTEACVERHPVPLPLSYTAEESTPVLLAVKQQRHVNTSHFLTLP
jgi:hypothetical protein